MDGRTLGREPHNKNCEENHRLILSLSLSLFLSLCLTEKSEQIGDQIENV